MRRGAGKAIWSMLAVMGSLALATGARAEEPKKNGSHGEEVGPSPAVLTSPNIKLELHSSIQLDFAGFSDKEDTIPNVAGSQENTIFAKRVRVTIKGKLFNNIGFYVTEAFDSTPNSAPAPYVIDAQASIPAAPWLEFTFGLMKMPFSEERLKSFATHMPFMERSLASNLENKRSQGAVMRLHTPDKDAVSFYAGIFTGELLTAPNTDDYFEYVGRIVFRFDQMFDGFPGVSNLGASFADGIREPIGNKTMSYTGKTMNELTWFQAVPVNGHRTRWEGDYEWRYQSVWFGGEYIHSEEQRNHVTVNLMTKAGLDKNVVRNLDPLVEEGFNVFFVVVLTGEDAKPIIEPKGQYGAVSLAVRYSMVSFDNQEHKIKSNKAPKPIYGREVNDTATPLNGTSSALGRKSINDAERDLTAGINWDLKPGVFIQFAVIYQWFDASNPYNASRGPGRYDVNYRGRVGVTF